MFYRSAGDERRKQGAGATQKVNGEAAISMSSANELDEKLMRIFCRPFPGLAKEVYDLDSLEEVMMERSGVAVYLPPAAVPALPASVVSGVLSNPARLGVLSLFEDQAEDFPGVIHVPLPNITSAAGLVETKEILEERGMWDPPKRYFDLTATATEIKAALRYGGEFDHVLWRRPRSDKRSLARSILNPRPSTLDPKSLNRVRYESERRSKYVNPPIPTQAPDRYRDVSWQRARATREDGMVRFMETGPDMLAHTRPEFTFAPQEWHSSRPFEARQPYVLAAGAARLASNHSTATSASGAEGHAAA